MSKSIILSAFLASLLAMSGPVDAQSVFGQPGTEEAQPTAPAAPAPAAPKPRPKPKKPTPARSIVISNASANVLTSLEITGEGKIARLAKPLAPKERTTLKLPALRTCVVAVSAGFEGAGEAEANDYNICREKSIRFTE